MLKAYVVMVNHQGLVKNSIVNVADESQFKPNHLENSGIVKRFDCPSSKLGVLTFNEQTQTIEIDQSKVRLEKLAELRQLRDQRLKADVDKANLDIEWAERAQSPKSSEFKQSWAQYRQSLLDLTEPYKADASLLDNLNIESVMPSKPV